MTAIPEAQKANEASFKRSTATRVREPDTTLHLCHPILHTVQPAPDAPACAGGRRSPRCAKSTYQVLKKSPNSEEKKNGSRTSGLPSDAWPARLLSKLHITPAKSHAPGRRAGLLGLRLSASGAPSPMALGGWGSLATADWTQLLPVSRREEGNGVHPSASREEGAISRDPGGGDVWTAMRLIPGDGCAPGGRRSPSLRPRRLPAPTLTPSALPTEAGQPFPRFLPPEALTRGQGQAWPAPLPASPSWSPVSAAR